MSDNKAIFIGATGQDVGKSTLCLGLLAALQQRFGKVGFIKPIGQHYVAASDGTKVDKDAVLFKEKFGLEEEWRQISPVILPSGFTRDFLDQKITEESLLENVVSSFQEIANHHEFTLVEGTGHIGVGSIINLNNAQVAAALGLDVILIATGGLGSAFDELALNIELCHREGVTVRGVILNRVLEDKRDMILEYFPKALKRWNIPLLGCVPYSELLSLPTMRDFELLFQTQLLSGHNHRYRHFMHKRLVAGSLEAYREMMSANELVITPASREEIVEELLAHADDQTRHCGLILTGVQPPSERLLALIQASDFPILYAPICSYEAMKRITSLVAKIRREDRVKIAKAIHLVESYLDIPALLSESAGYARSPIAAR